MVAGHYGQVHCKRVVFRSCGCFAGNGLNTKSNYWMLTMFFLGTYILKTWTHQTDSKPYCWMYSSQLREIKMGQCIRCSVLEKIFVICLIACFPFKVRFCPWKCEITFHIILSFVVDIGIKLLPLIVFLRFTIWRYCFTFLFENNEKRRSLRFTLRFTFMLLLHWIWAQWITKTTNGL